MLRPHQDLTKSRTFTIRLTLAVWLAIILSQSEAPMDKPLPCCAVAFGRVVTHQCQLDCKILLPSLASENLLLPVWWFPSFAYSAQD